MSRSYAWQRPEYREGAERQVRERYLDDRSWWYLPGEAVLVDRPWTERDYQYAVDDQMRWIHDQAVRSARALRATRERNAKLGAVERDHRIQAAVRRWLNARNPGQKRDAEDDLLTVLGHGQPADVAEMLQAIADRAHPRRVTA